MSVNKFAPARLVARIAVVNSHPIQYFGPLYARLNQSPHLDITALYLSDFSLRNDVDAGFGQKVAWDIDTLDGYRSVFIAPGYDRRRPGGFWSMVAPQIWREVTSGRYDYLWLHGHNYAANLIALAAAKAIGMPVFTRGETHLGLARPAWKRGLRSLAMPAFYGLFDACLAIGAANRRFYREMGVSEDRIHLTPYSVDNERFAKASRLSPAKRVALRHRLGATDDRPIIFFASKFTPRKRPHDLVAAFAQLRSSGLAAHLVLAGSGELEPALRRKVAELDLGEQVHFTGFVNQSALPQLYGACDVFVLPSDNEPWGLIVNEVMAAGMPVVVADEVGCAADLVRSGVNGETFVAGNVDGLAAALQRVLGDRTRLRAMAKASRRIIAGWGYDQVGEGLLAAIAATCARRRAMPAGGEAALALRDR